MGENEHGFILISFGQVESTTYIYNQCASLSTHCDYNTTVLKVKICSF